MSEPGEDVDDVQIKIKSPDTHRHLANEADQLLINS